MLNNIYKFKIIDRCRICKNQNLVSILSIGEQYFTGIFPRSITESISRGPLELVKCHGENVCSLVQLRHSFDLSTLYGKNYGYRSSLNSSMVRHLAGKVEALSQLVSLTRNDLVLDIGSNDGTLLSFYPDSVTRVGIDPTIAKFSHYYLSGIHTIADFYSAKAFRHRFGNRKAKIVTSISMYYDLEDPLSFAQEVKAVLAPDGVWHFEQSYLPTMLKNNAYDTICHEHLEYYSLHQIRWITERCGLRILDVEFNLINGGSFAVTVCPSDACYPTKKHVVDQILDSEQAAGVHTLQPYEEFRTRVFAHREHLLKTLSEIHAKNGSVLGYGASTKGNVLLQFCGLTKKEIPAIAEVNKDKFGAFTPGTLIPIISEEAAHKLNPDFLLVMPWHFRENFVSREKNYLERGGRMIFPLPSVEIMKK